MKLKFKNILVYDDDAECFEKTTLCCEDYYFVEDEGFGEEDVFDADGLIAIPSFTSGFGLLEKQLEQEISKPKQVAGTLAELYHKNGYFRCVEQIDSREVVKALANEVIESTIVSADMKLLEKANKISPQVYAGMLVDLCEDKPEEIDKKIAFARENEIPIYSNLYGDLARAGEISTQYLSSPIDTALDFGLLDREFISTNNVCVDKDDIVQMEEAYMCIAPKTNMLRGRGFEPLAMIKNYNDFVMFSVLSKDDLDMFENMRAALCEARASMNDENVLSEKDVFSWATARNRFGFRIGDMALFLLIKPPKNKQNIKNIKDLVQFCSSSDIVENFIFSHATCLDLFLDEIIKRNK